MDGLMQLMQGKKTYLVSVLAIGTVLVGFLNGDLTSGEAVLRGLEALGLATLRAGVGKVGG